MTLHVDWNAAVRFTQLNYRLGLDIANDLPRPRWNDGDFFDGLFDQ